MNDEPRLRCAVRALVLDEADRVLLVRLEFPHTAAAIGHLEHTWEPVGNVAVWVAPGGGISGGEDPMDALRRELREEVGLADVAIGPMIWVRTHIFPFLDGSADGQTERYFLVRTQAFEPQPELSWEELRREHMTDVRWWTQEELRGPDAEFAPRRLPELVADLLTDGPPPEPIDTGV